MPTEDVTLNDAFATWTQTHRDLTNVEAECACCDVDGAEKPHSPCCQRKRSLDLRATEELRRALSLLEVRAGPVDPC